MGRLGLGIVACALALGGCAPAFGARFPERHTARAAVLTLAEAVKVADHTCADLARELQSLELARTCDDGYGVARSALLLAEASVDAWDAGQQQRTLCAAGKAAVALRNVTDAVVRSGGKIPNVVEDALRVSASLGRLCHAGT
ncbi:hypothetical protein [Pendulispora albinea]|uniref:Lipoprotein n=1 Tax=Pendulispora albinea TaxID=2741071 RepID=A0ABZ2M228_9BACT